MARNYYAEIYYHFVWRTKGRLPMIISDYEKLVWQEIKNKVVKYGGVPLEVGGIADHVHLLIQAQPTLMPSEFIGKVKGGSSYDINRQTRMRMAWGEGYGVLTLAKINVDGVRAYIRNQRERHKVNRLRPVMERCEPEEPVAE